MRKHHLKENIQIQLNTSAKACLTLVLICLINASCVNVNR